MVERVRSAPARMSGRLGLLRFCRLARWSVLLPVVGCQVIAAVLPTSIALATGVFVSRVVSALRTGDGGGALVTVLAVLVFLLVLDQLILLLGLPLRRRLGAAIDGVVRLRLRAILSGPPGIGHLEDQEVRNHAQRVTRGIATRTLGQGAEAELTAVFMLAGGLMTLLSAAFVVPFVALYMTVFFSVLRARLAWQHGGFVNVQSARLNDVREGRYWLDIAGGPLAAKELRLFGLERWAIDRQFEAAARARRPVWDGTDEFVRRQKVPLVMIIVGYALPFVWLADRAASGSMRPGTVAFVVAALLASSSLGYIGDLWAIESAVVAAESLRALEALGRGGQSDALTGSLPRDHGGPPGIRFEDVTFAYGGGAPVLDGLSLELRPGESLAIVGSNGAGKTTLVKLLARLYEPSSGRITADGTDIASLDAENWRRRISAVFQDFVRYESTAADNVGVSELGAVDRARLDAAAAVAGTAEIIGGLPHGWDTILSRGQVGGVELSGGQWQRIAVARVVYGVLAGRDVVILDEPTANLDAEAELEIFDQLLAAARGQTVVLVSHRFSTVRRADRIAVLVEGAVAECGTHKELLDLGGHYATMFHTQADRYLLEPTETAAS